MAAFTYRLPLTPAQAQAAFPELSAWLRLNPQWEVLALDGRRLRVRYERDEREADFELDWSPAGEAWRLSLTDAEERREVWLRFAADPAGTTLTLDDPAVAAEDGATRAELALWARSTVDYVQLAARRDWRARLLKRAIDRLWLRMAPGARRIAVLVVAMEGLALVLLVALLLWWRVVGE